MNDFDQKRADRDTVFYNTDGRLFDLVETNEKLEIRSRPNAFSLLAFSLIISVGMAFLASKAFSGFTRAQTDWFIVASSLLNLLVGVMLMRFFGFYEPKKWILNKNESFIFADAKKLTPLSDISKVRCFKMGRRLKLVLLLHNGREFHLGWLRFARKEWAWRQDAAQIAEFLGVPLDIPAV